MGSIPAKEQGNELHSPWRHREQNMVSKAHGAAQALVQCPDFFHTYTNPQKNLMMPQGTKSMLEVFRATQNRPEACLHLTTFKPAFNFCSLRYKDFLRTMGQGKSLMICVGPVLPWEVI